MEPQLVLRQQSADGESVKHLKCKELSICTVLSRCLGPVDRWEQTLAPLANRGYNAIHFTPIQHYGASFSHYSLADQTEISDYYFTTTGNKQGQTSLGSYDAQSTLNSEESKAASPATPQAMQQQQALSKHDKFRRVHGAVSRIRE